MCGMQCTLILAVALHMYVDLSFMHVERLNIFYAYKLDNMYIDDRRSNKTCVLYIAFGTPRKVQFLGDREFSNTSRIAYI